MRNRTMLGILVIPLLLLAPENASAQCPGTYLYQQPDQTNVGVPCTNALQGYLDGQGESIDAVMDASLVPETFFPALQLTFTLIAEGAGYENIFGWYNVGDDINDHLNRHPVLFSAYDHPIEPEASDPYNTHDA